MLNDVHHRHHIHRVRSKTRLPERLWNHLKAKLPFSIHCEAAIGLDPQYVPSILPKEIEQITKACSNLN